MRPWTNTSITKLFNKTKKYNIINIDDNYGRKIIDIIGEKIPLLTYGIMNKGRYFCINIEFSLTKVKFNTCPRAR